MKRTKKCLYCGKEFSTQSAVKKYCCIECAEAAKQEIKKKRNSLLYELAPIANLRQQDYFTFSQAATLMGCSRQYIYKLVAQGKLHASRISDRMAIIRRKDIEDMLEGNPYRRVIPCQHPKANQISVCKSQQKGKGTSNEPMEYYSGEDVMRIYKVRQSWLYTSAKHNGIPTCRISGRTFYSKHHTDEFFGTAMDVENIEEWLTTSEASERYGMSAPSLRSCSYRHKIPTKREYGITYYSKQHLDEWFKPDLRNDDRFYTTAQACRLMNVTSANLTAIIKRYHITKERIGVSNLLLKSDVERAITERRAKGLM